MRINRVIYFFLIIFISGCASKAPHYETIDVCTEIKDPVKKSISDVKVELDQKAYLKFINKYKAFKDSKLFFHKRKYHGKDNLKSLCMKVDVGVTPNEKRIYETLEIKKSCYNAADVKVSASVENALDFGLKKAVSKKIPELMDKNWEKVRSNIFDINHSKPDIDLEKNSICLDINAKIYTDTNYGKEKSPSPFSYIEDFSGFKTGDNADQYGKNLIIQQSNNGNGVSTFDKKGSSAVFNAGLKNNLDIKIYIQNQSYEDIFKSKEITLAKFIYASRKEDQVKIRFYPYIFDSAKADILIGKTKVKEKIFPMASNYNVFRFVKKRREIKFFINGKFMGNFTITGDLLNKIKIPLTPDTTLDAVEINDLN